MVVRNEEDLACGEDVGKTISVQPSGPSRGSPGVGQLEEKRRRKEREKKYRDTELLLDNGRDKNIDLMGERKVPSDTHLRRTQNSRGKFHAPPEQI